MSFGNLVVGAAEKALTNPNGQGAAYFYTASSDATLFDVEGDGKADISIYRPINGQWWLQHSSDNSVRGMQFGISTDRIAPADYDGDRRSDIAVYRPSTGVWYILNSATFTLTYNTFGVSTDVPTPADYDGDGKADVSVFRPSSGTWYRQNSGDGTFSAFQWARAVISPCSAITMATVEPISRYTALRVARGTSTSRPPVHLQLPSESVPTSPCPPITRATARPT